MDRSKQHAHNYVTWFFHPHKSKETTWLSDRVGLVQDLVLATTLNELYACRQPNPRPCTGTGCNPATGVRLKFRMRAKLQW